MKDIGLVASGTDGGGGDRKVRAKTLQERMGFADHELSTPLHDEIVLWLDEHMDGIVQGMGTTGWSPSVLEWASLQRRRYPTLPEEIPEWRPPCVIRKEWEAAVLDRTFTVGFVDMLVTVGHAVLAYTDSAVRRDDWTVSEDKKQLAFEVKTGIPSLGEMIRQIRLYQTYLEDTRFFVVCPDDRWAEALKGQGIGFVRYPGADQR